jgi:ribonucleotide monophosphatase NagD (HAD superfamily)
VNLDYLFRTYRAFFIDAYGVLVTSSGALPGARDFIERLKSERREYFILTNDASRLPETAAAFYAKQGLEIPVERVLTSGLAVGEAFREAGLHQPRCAVLGTADSLEIIRRSGAITIEAHPDAEYDAVVIADDSGFEIIPTLNALLTSVHRMIKRGKMPRLFLPNPDLLYPRGEDAFGFTSGSVARLFELGLERLHPHPAPDLSLKFTPIGKPEPFLFEMALARAGVARHEAVMIGDQLTTDVLGANRVGLASVLMATGLTQLPLPENLAPERKPTYIMTRLG